MAITSREKTRKGQTWQLAVERPRDPITGKRNHKYKIITDTKEGSEAGASQIH